MSIPSDSNLIELAIDLAHSLRQPDRFERLLSNVRKTVRCDAVVLLKVKGSTLVPLAQQGLIDEAMGRRFVIEDHPRFQQICSAKQPVCFPSGSTLPDPYDGIIAGHPNIRVHACMGLPLCENDELFGVLTLDSLTASAFDQIPERTLAIISAMAAATLKTAILIQQLEFHNQRNQQFVAELTQDSMGKDEMIGQSLVMQRLTREIELVAPSDYTVLIEGETGAGKELVARMLHQHSNRADGPLVYVNCAAIPEQLVESELFGHVKGAFTGADSTRAGKFALANGGTLFLDEIGELPLSVQSKLLRALQNQEIQPVGQDQVEQVDVRVLAATNRQLQQEVADGHFRADLYHRLSVYPIAVPPLRERDNDITLLAGFFVEQIRRNLGLNNLTISEQALDILQHYDWPGNVRELEHVIRRAALRARARKPVRCNGQGEPPLISIEASDIEHLKSEIHVQQPTADHEEIEINLSLKHATENYQRKIIQRALEHHQGNWAAAARALQTDRANLNRLGKRLGVNVQKQVTANMRETE